MENIRHFLESSSVHGLSYISSTRKIVKLFWIIVVISGFTGAAFIIYESFQAWEESPITTTIETRPISEITFPKVTVCPPKNTYTDLNYDLMMAENMTLNKDTRNELKNLAIELLNDQLHKTIMKNLSKIEDCDRYYNWYHGYTLLKIPLKCCENLHSEIYIQIKSNALHGTLTTQHFGDKFEPVLVEADFWYDILFDPPGYVKWNKNITLYINVEWIEMIDLASGIDKFNIVTVKSNSRRDNDYVSDQFIVRNFTPPGHKKKIAFQRKVSKDDVEKMTLNKMPGFKLSWKYLGAVERWDQRDQYIDDSKTRAFVRNFFNNFSI